jgi:cytochrome c-type biogenesis protein CcmH
VTRALTPVAIAVIVIGVAIGIAAGRGDDAAAVSVDARAQEIAAGLRCPVCQNLSVADSPSRLAGEMRAEIVSRLHAGASPDDVRAYFVDRYGAWILLEPPRRGFDLIPWLVPLVGLVVGAALWVAIVRRRSRPLGDLA